MVYLTLLSTLLTHLLLFLTAREYVANNWTKNTTLKPDGHAPLDLLNENLNLELKVRACHLINRKLLLTFFDPGRRRHP